MGAQEPEFGVPSINTRAPLLDIIRVHRAGLSSCIERAMRPPMEWARSRTGWPLLSRAACAASTDAARRRASSSIGLRQSYPNSITS